MLSDLSGERIVILSSHIVSDVEAVATEIVLINKGHLLRHATPEQLLQLVEGKVWMCVISSPELTVFRQQHLISNTIRRSDGIHVRVITDSSPSGRAQSVSPTLEDAYLYCMSSANSLVSSLEENEP